MKILRVNYNDAASAVAQNDGFCPCKLDRTADTKCMCLQFREQIGRQQPGLCECGLYALISDAMENCELYAPENGYVWNDGLDESVKIHDNK